MTKFSPANKSRSPKLPAFAKPDPRRSRNMRAIKARDTSPERVLRQLLHSEGFRFLVCCSDLPGAPDVVLPKYRTAILVHGCFWHAHSCTRGLRLPKTNTRYWRAKREKNVRRDRRVLRQLRRHGWSCLTVWECQLRTPDRVARRIVRHLQRKVLLVG
jgi:DNA mismatch endonuclease (patch repair protein)